MQMSKQLVGLLKVVVLGAVLTSLTACATVSEEEDEYAYQDPFEPANRAVYGFNSVVDGVVLEPVARGYKKVTPEPVRECVDNITHNLTEPIRAVGNTVAFKFRDAALSGFRFAANTFLGGLGCLDPASDAFHLPEYDTDIGLGLRSTVEPSHQVYIVLPVFGPSTEFDLAGRIGESKLDPVEYENIYNPYWIRSSNAKLVVQGTRAVSTRSQYLEATDLVKELAFDEYMFVRDSYLEQRKAKAQEIRNRR